MAILLKMKTSLSGPRYSVSPGNFRPYADYEARRLVDADFATEATADEVKAFEEEHGPIAEFCVDGDVEPDAGDAADAPDTSDNSDSAAEADDGTDPANGADDAGASEEPGEGQEEGAAEEGGEAADGDTAKPVYADLGAARKAYREVFSKGPGPSWSIDQIAEKIAEKQAEG